MPFYLFKGRYSLAAIEAMVNNPQDRGEAARPLVEAVGGTLHHIFFSMGQDDVIALVEAPDDTAMTACAMAIGASGAFSGGATTKLMTTAEAVKAMQLAQSARGSYKPATG